MFVVSAHVLQRLQMVTNAAAPLVVGTGKFQHITPTFRDVLYWLPVTQRIEYKTTMITFNSFIGTGPSYFDDVCVPVSTIAAGRTCLQLANRGGPYTNHQ